MLSWLTLAKHFNRITVMSVGFAASYALRKLQVMMRKILGFQKAEMGGMLFFLSSSPTSRQPIILFTDQTENAERNYSGNAEKGNTYPKAVCICIGLLLCSIFTPQARQLFFVQGPDNLGLSASTAVLVMLLLLPLFQSL